MKNILLKTCLTSLTLCVAGLANVQSKEMDLSKYSAISGAALSIAAHPEDDNSDYHVNGHLAAQAAVSIGAHTGVKDIYAGAAVTTGIGSNAKQISAGAAVGVGTYGTAQDINAGAAVVVGAYGEVGAIKSGAAITLEVGATYYAAEALGATTFGAEAGRNSREYSDYVAGFIDSTDTMTDAMTAITKKITDSKGVDGVISNGDISGITFGPGVYKFGAINLMWGSNAPVTFDANGDPDAQFTMIASEAMTLSAGSTFILINGAKFSNITWILGGALNLGAGSKFQGVAYVNGAVNGATSSVCGSVYAIGAVAVDYFDSECHYPTPVVCPLWDDTHYSLERLANTRVLLPFTDSKDIRHHTFTDGTEIQVSSRRMEILSDYGYSRMKRIESGRGDNAWNAPSILNPRGWTHLPAPYSTYLKLCTADLTF
jgi:hypothetical protein